MKMIKPLDKRTKAYWKQLAENVMAENENLRRTMKRYNIEDMDLVPESLIEVCQPVSPQIEKELAWKDDRISFLSNRVAEKEKQLLELKMQKDWVEGGGKWKAKYFDMRNEFLRIKELMEEACE